MSAFEYTINIVYRILFVLYHKVVTTSCHCNKTLQKSCCAVTTREDVNY